MFERLKSLYEKRMVDETHLDVAISKGWITEEEKVSIMKIESVK